MRNYLYLILSVLLSGVSGSAFGLETVLIPADSVKSELESNIQEFHGRGEWTKCADLCLERGVAESLDEPVLTQCTQAFLKSDNALGWLRWTGGCQGEKGTIERRLLEPWVKGVNQDVVSLNSQFQALPNEEKGCLYHSIGLFNVEENQCETAHLLSLELVRFNVDLGTALWRAARGCAEREGPFIRHVLVAPIRDRSLSTFLAPVFRGFQSASSIIHQEKTQVIGAEMLLPESLPKLLQTLWTGKIGGLIVAISSQEELEPLKHIAGLTESPIGIVPIGDVRLPVQYTANSGVIDLRLDEKAIIETLLNHAREFTNTTEIALLSSDDARVDLVQEVLSLLELDRRHISTPKDIRGDKKWIEQDYKAWASGCRKGTQCAVMLDMDVKSATHLIPYLELNGPPVCANERGTNCIQVLGRRDWNVGKGGDRSGRRTDGAIFSVDFDSTNPMPAVGKFVEDFEEQFARRPADREALVYALVELLHAVNQVSKSQEKEERGHWTQAFQEIGELNTVLGALTWEDRGYFSRAPFMMTMLGESPQFWQSPDEKTLDDIIKEIPDE